MFGVVVGPEVPGPAKACTNREAFPFWKSATLSNVYSPEKLPGKKLRMSSLL